MSTSPPTGLPERSTKRFAGIETTVSCGVVKVPPVEASMLKCCIATPFL